MKVRRSKAGYWSNPSATARWLNMTKAADVVSWSAIQMTVQRKMPTIEKKEYAGWKRLISMVRSQKAISTKRGYNKFLSMDGEVKVAINYDRIADDSKWDGLKGYLTNTDIPIQDVYTAYHNLWHVERAFRIAKSKIEIRPMFHFTRKRIEAHICICFVALKVYKELDRMLKVSEIKMSVDKVLALAKTITTIQIKLYTQTMLMARHQKIAKLFDEDFWVTQ